MFYTYPYYFDEINFQITVGIGKKHPFMRLTQILKELYIQTMSVHFDLTWPDPLPRNWDKQIRAWLLFSYVSTTDGDTILQLFMRLWKHQL